MTRATSKILPTTLFAAMLAAFLSAPQPAAARACIEVEAPVCAVKGGVRQTYGNACKARLAHARVLHNGRCVATGPFCFFIYAPVCAINPATHKRQTYPNLCSSELANARVVSHGACP